MLDRLGRVPICVCGRHESLTQRAKPNLMQLGPSMMILPLAKNVHTMNEVMTVLFAKVSVPQQRSCTLSQNPGPYVVEITSL